MSDALSTYDLYGLSRIVAPLYEAKDTMHDWSHIMRCFTAAIQIINDNALHPHYPRLAAGLILHGVIYEANMEERVKALLMRETGNADETAKIIHVAWESQKESPPETLEGGILHDAHLLEGDENFLITKCLVTGTARGQKLDQTVRYFFENIVNQKPDYAFDATAHEYKRRYQRAVAYFTSLRNSIHNT
ncbi:MAG: hypothetical protein WBK91_01980 [Alphaproteobacteria bacterium]